MNYKKELKRYILKSKQARRAKEFDSKNPRFYMIYKQLAEKALSRGHKRYGSKSIFEVMRWDMTVNNKDIYGFKANNNYTAYYALKLSADDKRFEGFFKINKKRKY